MLREDYHVLYVTSAGTPVGEPDEVLVSAGNDALLKTITDVLATGGYEVRYSTDVPGNDGPRETVAMGMYPQNGPEPAPLRWLVLKKNSDRALVVALSVLDSHRFDPDTNKWEDSEIRRWLNGEFADAAFTADERAGILTDENGDSVFLLSSRQADAYFHDADERKGEATAYAVKRGVNHYDWAEGKTWWWLRTPGEHANNVALVSTFGTVFTFGDNRVIEYGGVRPAMWVKL